MSASPPEGVVGGLPAGGEVFDSATGAPISGAVIRLVEDPPGIDGSPLGDDGVSPFPATITSGGTATDGVKIYNFAPGTYRSPWVPAGTYRLEVTPPSGYVYPSTAASGHPSPRRGRASTGSRRWVKTAPESSRLCVVYSRIGA